jgi:hypothetical protein
MHSCSLGVGSDPSDDEGDAVDAEGYIGSDFEPEPYTDGYQETYDDTN